MGGMRRTFINYFANHLRGEQSLPWSFFVNGLLFYLLLTGAIIGAAYELSRFAISIDLSVVVFVILASWFVWSIVGNVRAALRVLKSRDRSFGMKTFAVFVLLALCVIAVYVVSDVVWLYGGKKIL